MISPSVDFNVADYYSQYPSRVISRPGYPTRAVFKAYLAWSIFKDILVGLPGGLNRVADVGGCFGFGLNAFLFHGKRILGTELYGDVYELGEDYRRIGSLLFPKINFVGTDFTKVELGHPYDVALFFDLLEHIPDVNGFLAAASARTRYAIVKTPLETTWLNDRLIAQGRRPPIKSGAEHEDGHVHFFTFPRFVETVSRDFEVVAHEIIHKWPSPALIDPESASYVMPSMRLRCRELAAKLLGRRGRYFFPKHMIRGGFQKGHAFLLLKSKWNG
jgi:hypothetical protein